MSLGDWEKQGQKAITNSSDPKTKILLAAVKSGEKLHIRYSKPNGVDQRWITPKKIFSKAGEVENYVEAHCHKRNANRVFMIKRIRILTEKGENSGTEPTVAPRTSFGSVTCSVDYVELDGDYGPVDGVEVTCNRCGHVTQSFGDGPDSIRRCLALMKEECPRGGSNWYIEE